MAASRGDGKTLTEVTCSLLSCPLSSLSPLLLSSPCLSSPLLSFVLLADVGLGRRMYTVGMRPALQVLARKGEIDIDAGDPATGRFKVCELSHESAWVSHCIVCILTNLHGSFIVLVLALTTFAMAAV